MSPFLISYTQPFFDHSFLSQASSVAHLCPFSPWTGHAEVTRGMRCSLGAPSLAGQTGERITTG